MTSRGLALAVALIAIGACSRKTEPASAAARRVVSLGPATTEALFALGAGDAVVGRSKYCDWPPEVTKVPVVGGIEPDTEAILELRPDLVVGPSGGWSARLAGVMHERGVATWFPDEIQSLEGVDALVVELGSRTAHSADAARVIDGLHERERAVERAVAGEARPRVLLVAGLAPVYVAGPSSFADDMVRRAGGTNVVTQGGAWLTLGFERIMDLDPDVVLDATVAETGGATHITADAAGWRGLRAVRDAHVVPLNDERVLRPGPRVAEGLAVLARALHPGAAVP
jgi:iron complex transport system substrate-binding protein